MSTIISASEVTVRYNERSILDAATLGIQAGDRIGLVGRNGCGKTTFLKLLAGLQHPDGGEVSRQRDLVASYLPQDFMLDATKNVHDNIRAGAQHVLNLIAEFESLPHDSKRHEELEARIATLEGWTVDRRIEVAMAHLNCPAGDRRIETLSGGEKRRSGASASSAKTVVSSAEMMSGWASSTCSSKVVPERAWPQSRATRRAGGRAGASANQRRSMSAVTPASMACNRPRNDFS